MEEIIVKAEDGLELSCFYSEAQNPKALVQIVHGMAEHKERYIGFIEKLNEAGYTVIMGDLRGHGKSLNEKYTLGYIEEDMLVKDEYTITKYIKEKNPNLDLYLFGHSMGSLIVRMYLKEHDDEIKKLIICGTVCPNPGAGLGVFIGKRQCSKNGAYRTNETLFMFSNGMSKDPSVDWLTFNEENVKKYMADPLCGFKFTNRGYQALFQMVVDLKKPKKFECKNPTLPILSVSGAQDRTTGGAKGLAATKKALNKIGYNDITIKEYDHMKHEILNEDDAQSVINDIIAFFSK